MGCAEFGEKLAGERRTRKLGTQKEFGILLGRWSRKLGQNRGPVPEETVCRWEKGCRYPGKWYAFVICDLLKMSPDALALQEVLPPAVMVAIEASLSSTPDALVPYQTSLLPTDPLVTGRSLPALPGRQGHCAARAASSTRATYAAHRWAS
jgi:hypothetical protein